MKEFLNNYLGNPTITKLLIITIGLIAIWVIIKIIQRRLFVRILDNDNRYRARKFVGFIGFILTIVLFSVVYSDKLSGLTMALGVAGAGIAFALQEVIASAAGWLTIMFGGFFKTGDRVQLGGIRGDIIDIGVLRTTIMETGEWVDGDLYNGRIVLVANSFVFKEPVFNYSADFPFLWDEIKIPIKYGSDYIAAQKLFERVANEVCGDLPETTHKAWKGLVTKYAIEDAQTAPMVSLVANDNWVEYTVRYVVNYKKRRSIKNALYLKILAEIEQSDAKIAFASATFEMVGMPDLHVKVGQ